MNHEKVTWFLLSILIAMGGAAWLDMKSRVDALIDTQSVVATQGATLLQHEKRLDRLEAQTDGRRPGPISEWRDVWNARAL